MIIPMVKSRPSMDAAILVGHLHFPSLIMVVLLVVLKFVSAIVSVAPSKLLLKLVGVPPAAVWRMNEIEKTPALKRSLAFQRGVSTSTVKGPTSGSLQRFLWPESMGI